MELSVHNFHLKAENDKEKRTFYKVLRLFIDGKSYEGAVQTLEDDRTIEFEYSIPLKGKKLYRINRVMERRFSLEKDPYVQFAFTKFIEHTEVMVYYPKEDLSVQFVPIGTA